MIYLGAYSDEEKASLIERYRDEHGIRNTVVISPKQHPFELPWADNIEWAETIMYRTFYRLLQEIHDDSLIVLSDPLRTQNRYDLTYNCIRNFLNQTSHQLIFSHLPQIDTRQDFMILFDFDTRSRWKRRKWDINLVLDHAEVHTRPVSLAFNQVIVPTSPATKRKYEKEKARRFEKLGARDPHTIPRNLYLIGGPDKRAYIDELETPQLGLFDDGPRAQQFVARNQRLNRDNVVTYQTATGTDGPYTIVEFPHRFIEFSDFVKLSGQTEFDVLMADLKVDCWYFQRYTEWKERIDETYASLQQ